MHYIKKITNNRKFSKLMQPAVYTDRQIQEIAKTAFYSPPLFVGTRLQFLISEKNPKYYRIIYNGIVFIFDCDLLKVHRICFVDPTDALKIWINITPETHFKLCVDDTVFIKVDNNQYRFLFYYKSDSKRFIDALNQSYGYYVKLNTGFHVTLFKPDCVKTVDSMIGMERVDVHPTVKVSTSTNSKYDEYTTIDIPYHFDYTESYDEESIAGYTLDKGFNINECDDNWKNFFKMYNIPMSCLTNPKSAQGLVKLFHSLKDSWKDIIFSEMSDDQILSSKTKSGSKHLAHKISSMSSKFGALTKKYLISRIPESVNNPVIIEEKIMDSVPDSGIDMNCAENSSNSRNSSSYENTKMTSHNHIVEESDMMAKPMNIENWTDDSVTDIEEEVRFSKNENGDNLSLSKLPPPIW